MTDEKVFKTKEEKAAKTMKAADRMHNRRRALKRLYGLHGKRKIKYRRLNMTVQNILDRRRDGK